MRLSALVVMASRAAVGKGILEERRSSLRWASVTLLDCMHSCEGHMGIRVQRLARRELGAAMKRDERGRGEVGGGEGTHGIATHGVARCFIASQRLVQIPALGPILQSQPLPHESSKDRQGALRRSHPHP